MTTDCATINNDDLSSKIRMANLSSFDQTQLQLATDCKQWTMDVGPLEVLGGFFPQLQLENAYQSNDRCCFLNWQISCWWAWATHVINGCQLQCLYTQVWSKFQAIQFHQLVQVAQSTQQLMPTVMQWCYKHYYHFSLWMSLDLCWDWPSEMFPSNIIDFPFHLCEVVTT